MYLQEEYHAEQRCRKRLVLTRRVSEEHIATSWDEEGDRLLHTAGRVDYDVERLRLLLARACQNSQLADPVAVFVVNYPDATMSNLRFETREGTPPPSAPRVFTAKSIFSCAELVT